jgi:hypothetical protein
LNLTTVERYLKKKKEAAPDDSATVPPMQAQNSSQTFSPTFPLSLFSISREFERKEEGDGIRTFLILNGGEGGGPTFLSLDPCSIQPHWKREEKKKKREKKYTVGVCDAVEAFPRPRISTFLNNGALSWQRKQRLSRLACV